MTMCLLSYLALMQDQINGTTLTNHYITTENELGEKPTLPKLLDLKVPAGVSDKYEEIWHHFTKR